MSKVPALDADPLWAAFIVPICDLVAAQTVTLQKLLELLERKGLLSDVEISQAIGSLPPDLSAATSAQLQKLIRERMERAILGYTNPAGPTQ